MPVQIVLMFLTLVAGGAYFLIGQQTVSPIPSEEADWPWRVVTEGKLFLNGAPAGELNNYKPISTKMRNFIDLLYKKRTIGEFERPSVFIVADPMISVGRVAELYTWAQESNGGPFLITNKTLSGLGEGGKPNPQAMVVTTENVDPGVITKLSKQKPGDVETAAPHLYMTLEPTSAATIRIGRTYKTSIEISSDGRIYLNEKNGVYKAPVNINPNFNAPLPPSVPLKQRLIGRADLSAAAAGAVDSSEKGHKILNIIVSEKAAYQSLLTVIESITDPDVEFSIMIRQLDLN